MKKIIVFLIFICLLQKLTAQFSSTLYPVYNGKDLGLTYNKTSSSFRIWSPPAEEAELILYKEGENGTALKNIDLKKGINGTWFTKLNGDWKGTFYVFRVKIKGRWSNEVTDPYAKAVGINGKRAMVII